MQALTCPAFFCGTTEKIAAKLLGCYLIHNSKDGQTVGRIVEVEGYLSQQDEACHAHRGQTKRNSAMFGQAGHAYVYLIYGVHYCFNVVTAAKEIGEAVLVRALEPVSGIELMQQRRKISNIRKLCNGPGCLTRAMGIGPQHNNCVLWQEDSGTVPLASSLSIARPVGREKLRRGERIACGKRIGISAAKELPLRFALQGNIYLSKPI